MPITPDEAFNLIQQSAQITGQQRIDIFEFLSETYSVIPIKGGFPDSGSPSGPFKAPLENEWSRWCHEKRPFNRSDFQPERAGIACGPASNILVLDVDDINEFHSWCYLNGITKNMPPTLTIRTGGEGERFHFYFQYPTDGKAYKNRSVKGIFDIRSVGGQVICPGSLHPETRKPYTIESNYPIALPPDWLLEYSLTKRTPADSENVATETLHSEQQQLTQEQSMNNIPPEIASLPVSSEIKSLIVTPLPKGQRSEASMKVLIALLSSGVAMPTIENIFRQQSIGEKSREAGQQWFDREFDEATKYVASNKNTQPPASTQATDQANTQASIDKYCVMNALEVANSDKPFEFIIENVWPKGEPLMITGSGGVGKSVMTLQIAMDLVNSAHNPRLFLDKFNIHGEHKVLFVQSENALVGLKKRLQVIRPAYIIPDNDLKEKIFFLGMKDDIRVVGDVEKPIFLETIRKAVHETGADILIIDPLISFHAKNENSNDEMRRVLDSVSTFCDEEKVTPLLIHHHAKAVSNEGRSSTNSGGGRGASAIGDWSANTWELSRTKNAFKFANNKSRNFKLQDELELELVNLRFRQASVTTQQNKASVVVQALQELGGKASSKKELAEKIHELSKQDNRKEIAESTANKHIETAVAEGSVVEAKATGNQKEYSLKI